MDLKPDPVKILDIAEIVRSPTEKDLGPWFYVDARKTPIFIEVRYLIHLFLPGITAWNYHRILFIAGEKDTE